MQNYFAKSKNLENEILENLQNLKMENYNEQ